MDRKEPTFGDITGSDFELLDTTTSGEKPDRTYVRLATPGRRYFGQILDGLFTYLIFIFSMYIFKEYELNKDYMPVVSISLAVIYFVFCDALPKGKSIAKLLLNISVVDADTREYCTLGQSFLRNIMTPILGLFDAVFILFKKRQRIGDIFANTMVIRNS